jgi:hypothetical protein
MTKDEFCIEYYNWMYRMVNSEFANKKLSYRKLLLYLHNIDFTYSIPMDGNRFEDGVDLRYRFGYERGYSLTQITSYIDCRPCSVLEMMVALAIRCEERIMDDCEKGNRIGLWFYDMIENLDLSEMTDDRFDEKYTCSRVNTFLKREYEPNGKGGLFMVRNCLCDMRSAEIWYQMCWFLDELL